MGGNASKALAKKAARPVKNIFFEERAIKAIDKQKKNPTAAPRHPSTKKLIEKQVEENPHIKEEVKKEDPSLIDRVNKLQLQVSDETAKNTSKDHRLPQSTRTVEDPLLAFEDPKRVPKGQISYTMLFTMLGKHENEPTTFRAEMIAKEHELNVQDAANILQYYEKIDIESMLKAAMEEEEEEKVEDEDTADVTVDNEPDINKKLKKTPS